MVAPEEGSWRVDEVGHPPLEFKVVHICTDHLHAYGLTCTGREAFPCCDISRSS